MNPAHASGSYPAQRPPYGPAVHRGHGPELRPRPTLALLALLCGLLAVGSALVPVATGEVAIGARVAAVVLVALGALLSGVAHIRARPNGPIWRTALLAALWSGFGLAVGLFALVIA